MLALAGYPLGCSSGSSIRAADSPGAQVGPIVLGSFDDPASLRELARDVDLVTYEFENVPVVGAARGRGVACPASRRSTRCACRRTACSRRNCSRRLGIPTPPFRAVDSLADLRRGRRRDRPAERAQDAAPRLRRPRPACPAAAAPTSTPPGKRCGGVPLILEGFVALRPRGVDRRRAQHARRDPRLPARREHAPRRASCA